MSRFYIPPDCVKGDLIYIQGKEAHHILDVMRLRRLDDIVAFDGTGKEYRGIIKKADARSLVVEVTKTTTEPSGARPTILLLQSIPKKEKMEYIIEKATELGVSAIIPLMTERTIVDWDQEKRGAVVSRWKKIALEASKQCGRRDIPVIDEVRGYDEALRSAGECDLSLMAALADGASTLKDLLSGFKGRKVAIAIGPEGDFTPQEIGKAKAAGFRLVSLGSRVLKSDTAGLAVLAVLDYELSA